jgi:hypothetical protein
MFERTSADGWPLSQGLGKLPLQVASQASLGNATAEALALAQRFPINELAPNVLVPSTGSGVLQLGALAHLDLCQVQAVLGRQLIPHLRLASCILAATSHVKEVEGRGVVAGTVPPAGIKKQDIASLQALGEPESIEQCGTVEQ